MTDGQLLNLEPARVASKALVPIGRGCPECRYTLVTISVSQPALFRHAGYGATVRTTWDFCPGCLWSVVRAVTETSPRRV